jgi:hypothetical protein
MKLNLSLLIGLVWIVLMLSGCETLSFLNSDAPDQTEQTEAAEANYPVQEPDETPMAYPIIGAVERVTFRELPFPADARIDTGATTSSIDARRIKAFERDGEPWVRFEVLSRMSEEKIVLEKPVTRIAHIEQHGKDHKRYVVRLAMRIGEESDFVVREFTLRSRKFFDYPVLIGRNVLEGVFLIDAAGEYLLGHP